MVNGELVLRREDEKNLLRVRAAQSALRRSTSSELTLGSF